MNKVETLGYYLGEGRGFDICRNQDSHEKGASLGGMDGDDFHVRRVRL